MAKTMPQLVKIDRADPEQVQPHVEPYAWQRAGKAPRQQQPDPWETPTVRLPLGDAPKAKR